MANPVGRPTAYTDEKADAICNAMIEFDDEAKPRGLRKILDSDGMPSLGEMFRWLEDHEYFRDQYTRARRLQATLYAEYRNEVAEENPQVTIPTKNGEYTITDSAAIQRNRLRFEAASTHAAQLDAKKYGKQLEVTTTNDPLAELLTEMREEYKGLAKKDETAETV